MPCAGSLAVLAAVRDGRADAGCVPIENSVEGAVPPVLDGLLDDPPLMIVKEVVLAVRFAVMVRAGTPLDRRPHGRLAQPRHRPDPQLDRPQPARR